jgi:hypothetical protein
MSLFLKIENKGVAPFEGFTVFGATSKRTSSNPLVIGTFGSGGKMAIGTLLRANINPQVFCGLTKLSFFTKPMTMKATGGDVTHKQVCVQFGGKIDGASVSRTTELSFVLDYGTSDWNNIGLALREFVSNAIDGQIDATGDFDGVTVEVVDESKVRAKDGFTRVFVPLTESVQAWFNEINKWFLHFSEPEVVRQGIQVLPKANRNRSDSKRPVIYRRGVFVREWQSTKTESIFDYNLTNVQLNEARTFDDWNAKLEVGRAIRNSDRSILAQLFLAMQKGLERWELTALDEYGLLPQSWDNESGGVAEKRKTEWQAAAALVIGDNGVFCDDHQTVTEMCGKKGFNAVPVANEKWVQALKANGVRTDEAILTSDDKKGREFLPATDAVIQAVEIVWSALVELGYTNGKQKPGVGCFKEPLDCEGKAIGLCRIEAKMVYAHEDYAQTLNELLVGIIVEECIHHASGATDFSRDFQTMQTEVIGRLIWRAYVARQ